VQIGIDESGHILRLAGSLEIREVDELHRALRDFLSGESKPVIDLSAVESCDTAGLQLLVSARKTAERAGKPFRLTGIPVAVSDAAASLGVSLSEAGPSPVQSNLAQPSKDSP
jgi:anti-anti-sigma factor